MPEATLNEHDLPVPGQNDVWTAWKHPAMYPKTVAHPVQNRPYRQLWLSVLATDAAHQERPFRFSDRIHALSLNF